MYTSEQLKAAMTEAAVGLPQSAAEVRALREKMLDARDSIPVYEAKIAESLRTKHTWNIDALEACLEQARTTFTDTQRELRSIAPAYIIALEAQERAKALEAEQQKQREQEQLANAAMQEAEAKESTRIHYLANGGTPAQFEKSWPSLWAAEVERRTLQGQDALRQRMLATGKYS